MQLRRLWSMLAEGVADATLAFVAGIIDWQAAGALSPAIRERSGELLARVVELQLAHIGEEIDFDAVRSQAVRALYQRHGDAYRAVSYDKATVDAGFMELTGYVFLVADKVVASELKLRGN